MGNFCIGQYVDIDILENSEEWESIGSYPGDELGNTYDYVYFSKAHDMIAVFEMDASRTKIEAWNDEDAEYLKQKCEESDKASEESTFNMFEWLCQRIILDEK